MTNTNKEVYKEEQTHSIPSNLLFEASHLPMLIIEPVSKIIFDANKAALDFYGYAYKQITSLKISDINQLDNDQIQQEIALAQSQKRDHFYFTHKLANGQLKEVEVHSGPIILNDKQFLYSIIHDITERRAAEHLVGELNRDFITLLENTTDFVYFKDKNGRYRFCSQTLATLTGHNSWRDLVGKHDQEVFPVDTAKVYCEEELPILSKGQPLLNKIDPYYNDEGELGWINTNKWPVIDQEGNVSGLFGISRDVTQQYETEKQRKIADSVFNNINEGIIVTDPKGIVIEVNNAFCLLSGYSKDEICGSDPRFLKSGHHDSTFFKLMWDSLLRDQSWQGDIWNRRKDGAIFASKTTITAVTDNQGNVSNYIGTFSDITSQIKEHEAIEKMAYYDALTGLPNRILFKDRLGQALAQADRTKGKLAVCFLDLDKFKPVNDKFGHKAGDLLLKEIAHRLEGSIRESDTIARMGGDEFAIIIPNFTDIEELQNLMKRMLENCSQPYKISESITVQVSISIGVSFYPDHDSTGEKLLHLADQAMYKAKKEGSNQYFFKLG